MTPEQKQQLEQQKSDLDIKIGELQAELANLSDETKRQGRQIQSHILHVFTWYNYS